MQKYTFDAVILKRKGLDAAYVEFPFDVFSEFGVKGRVPVSVQFDGVSYRGSLVKMGTDCHIIGLTKAIRQQIGKHPGEMVHVELIRDAGERKLEVPPVMQDLLKSHPKASKAFGALSYTNQKEYVRWITSAKRGDTLQRRLDKMAGMLENGVKHP